MVRPIHRPIYSTPPPHWGSIASLVYPFSTVNDTPNQRTCIFSALVASTQTRDTIHIGSDTTTRASVTLSTEETAIRFSCPHHTSPHCDVRGLPERMAYTKHRRNTTYLQHESLLTHYQCSSARLIDEICLGQLPV